MKVRLSALSEVLRANYWLFPSVMAILGGLLAFGVIWVDQQIDNDLLDGYGWIYAGGAEGARAVLNTIAGSVMTVTGVVFSITIAALTLASQQFGPRLLRNFMRDRGSQIVLGTFIGTFIYCLLVLRTIRGTENNILVPHLAVTLGVLLAIVSVAVLIYFIHHISTAIQAPQVLAAVARELDEVIERLYPEPATAERANPEPLLPDDFDAGLLPVPAAHTGYVRGVDNDLLLTIARDTDAIVRLRVRPGAFIAEGAFLADVFPPPLPADRQALTKRLNKAFLIGSQRTETEDIVFAIRQLVEVAVRALSPGINDPFTAVSCVDWLSAALRKIVGRAASSAFRYDENNQLRVIAQLPPVAEVLEAAVTPIRQSASQYAIVSEKLLAMLASVAAAAICPEDRLAVLRQAQIVRDTAQAILTQSADRDRLHARYREAIRAADQDGDGVREEE